MATMTSDKTILAQTASLLFVAGTVTELRILETTQGVLSGYYNDVGAFVKDAALWSGKAPAVYATLNPCPEALLARGANRLRARAKTTTSDSDTLKRCWFPLDFDPVRPAGVSSTDAEHVAAHARAAACTDWLTHRGWPQPIMAESGNGAHLLYAIDLPNDEKSRTLLKDCLEALAVYCTDSVVALDTGVFNAARIWKVYGTMACKGDHLPERPHRLATLLHVPTPIQQVGLPQLQALAALTPTTPQHAAPPHRNGSRAFDLAQWIADHDVPVVTHMPWGTGGTKWVMNPCPWNSAHTNGSAFVVQLPNGAIAAGCHHNGCQGQGWQALRALYEPGWHPQPGLSSYQARTGGPSGDPHEIRPNGLSSLSSLSSYPEWPTLAPEACYGLAGEFAQMIVPHSEADPVALLIQFLTYFGVLLGRSAYYQIEATRHYANLNSCLVGPTSKGRKGTAYDHIERLMQTLDTSWTLSNVSGGCGSGEGLIAAVRDKTTRRDPLKTNGHITGYQEVETDPGVIDKRLLVYEAEFSSVLKVASREGNLLSEILRKAWETGNLRNTVKQAPLKATGAHIAIIGHITIEELQRALTGTEMANGFGNRFLWLCVRRTKLLPDGGALHTVNFDPFLAKLRAAFHAAKTTQQMHRSAAARAAWQAVYPALSAERPGLVGSLLGRAEAQVLRLSMLYALLDGTAEIAPAHLDAALALWEYVEASVGYIFGKRLGDPVADTLLTALLRAHPGGLSRKTILEDTFQGNTRADELDRVLGLLQRRRRITLTDVPPEGGRGRRKQVVTLRLNELNEFNELNEDGYLTVSKDAVKAMALSSYTVAHANELNPDASEEVQL